MNEQNDTTDLLARAEAALSDLPIPAGPSDETLARTLAALAAAEVRPAKPVTARKRATIFRMVQFAAAVLVAAGGLVYLGYRLTQPAVAFADVAKKIAEADTLACQITMKTPDLKEPLTMRFLAREPGLMRMERADGGFTILDASRTEILAVDPTMKTAILMNFKMNADGPARGTASLVETLRKLGQKDGKAVGKKKVGDIEAHGFRVTEGDQEITVWADPKTKLPVLIEGRMKSGGLDAEFTMTDFQLNPKLDDAVFRLEAPAGYKLVKFEAEDLKPEEDVARLLRAYAKKKDGKFPAKLDDFKVLAEIFTGEPKPDPAENPEVMKLAMSLGRVAVHLKSLKGVGYKGEGVKLGDADKIVFWYKPEKAEKYRVLYGDLKSGDVTADKLPEKPKE